MNISNYSPSNNVSSKHQDNMTKIPLKAITNNIIIGSLDCVGNRYELSDHKVRYVLNLTHSTISPDKSCQIECFNLPVSSSDFRSMMRQLPKCIKLVDHAVRNDQNILVCCRNGYTRSLMVIMSYFMIKYNSGYRSVYQKVRDVLGDQISVTPECERHLMRVSSMITV